MWRNKKLQTNTQNRDLHLKKTWRQRGAMLLELALHSKNVMNFNAKLDEMRGLRQGSPIRLSSTPNRLDKSAAQEVCDGRADG